MERVIGLQLGAKGSKYETDSLVEEGLGKEAHLARACAIASAGEFPSLSELDSELDIQFVVCQAIIRIENQAALREIRDAFRALGKITARMDNHIRGLMAPSVRAVAGELNISLSVVRVVAMRWPDTDLPRRFFEGFPIVGDIPGSNVFKPNDDAKDTNPEQLLRNYAKKEQAMVNQGPSKEWEFLIEACKKDKDKGFGSDVCTRVDMTVFACLAFQLKHT